MRVLVTRPRAEAERTAAALARRGHAAILAPMLEIETVDASIRAGEWAGLLLTSGNAARALVGHPARDALLGLPVFAVGKQTGLSARELGFGSVTSADGDGGDLVRLILTQNPNLAAPYIYLAGNDRARDLGAELAVNGIKVETVAIYRANAADALPDTVKEALAQKAIGGVLHFSRRTAAIFCDCVGSAGLIGPVQQLAHCALSPRAAEPLAALGVRDVRIAARPDEDALLDLLPPA